VTSADAVRTAYRRIAAADRPEVWITLRPEDGALVDAAVVDQRVAAGERLPLAGTTVAVKDNIDVAGLPTTAGCPAFAYHPERSAPAVERLVAAGAVVIGKTNMDQFATGLVGTRTPYGPVRDARRPDRISGGSSSGSAVAVALGMADIALGTDTAGSGRVPAAFQGIVGMKPTFGLVPVRGVVPACRTLDCVSVFAPDVALAERALAAMAGVCAEDPLSRDWPPDVPSGAPPAPRVGMPRLDQLPELSTEAARAFTIAASRLAEAGAELVEIDFEPFRAAGALLYGGAFVAERHAAVGAFIETHPDDVDPTVAAIIGSAAAPSASALARDVEVRDKLRLLALEAIADVDVLLAPTVPAQPTIADVAARPVEENTQLGVYTNFCNLLDLCATAVPAGDADGGSFGVTIFGRAFADRVVADVAGMLGGGAEPALRPPATELFVVGAHRSGQPLNHELTTRGARLAGTFSTAPAYRLYRLQTDPPKPGVVRVDHGGAAVEGELWLVSPTGLGTLLASLPSPMALGRVLLEDGSSAVGFLCEPAATAGAEDITRFGSWPAYLNRTPAYRV
jgi:allophanate hydrolase